MVDQAKQTDLIESLCRTEFYKVQTEEENPTQQEVDEYFIKLLKDPDDGDFETYVRFQEAYKAKLGGDHASI